MSTATEQPDSSPAPASCRLYLWEQSETGGRWVPLERFVLTGGRQRFSTQLPVMGSGAAHLQFHFTPAGGFLRVLRVSLGSERQLAIGMPGWSVETMTEIMAASKPRDLKYCRSLLGEVLMITGQRPMLEIRGELKPNEGLREALFCEFELEAPHSWDYAIARDFLVREESELRERLQQQAARIEELETRSRELDEIKSSKAWLGIQRARQVLYVDALRRYPRLQSFLLTVTRKGPKAAWRAIRDPAVLLRQERAQDGESRNREQYQKFLDLNRITEQRRQEIRSEIVALSVRPKISIVMPTYNTPTEWLAQALASLEAQLYGNWELCVVDDSSTDSRTRRFLADIQQPRIKVRFLKRRKRIAGATNEAMSFATGDYIGFLDHDDVLTEDALFEMVKAINSEDPDLMYSDEDFIGQDGTLFNPHFKPDFSPELLLSHNYITHFLLCKRELVAKVGSMNSDYDGAQDYDFVLRATEGAGKIWHVPKVLYHWRQSESSTSLDEEVKPKALVNAQRAIESALERRRITAEVLPLSAKHFFRVKRPVPAQRPLVTIIIPFKDGVELLRACLDSVLQRTIYKELEIIGISNNSERPETFAYMKEMEAADRRIHFHELNTPFNFSKLCNRGAALARGEHIVLMNNDVEIISWDWVENMLEHSMRPEVGAVGGKLLYEDDTVQHAGIVVGISGYAGHGHKHFPANHHGYFNRLQIVNNVSAVTAAWMMVKKEVYEDIGGFDEHHLQVACNDVDFCLRLREQGLWNIYTPFAQAYHYESKTRGYEQTPEQVTRFEREKKTFRTRHAAVLSQGDPFYNPNLTLEAEDYSLSLE